MAAIQRSDTRRSFYGSSNVGSALASPRSSELSSLRERFRESMKRAGVDDRFLTDEHFETGWRKHFQDLAEDSKHGVKQSFASRNLRVLQWNVLAEGLCPDGFLMPLVSSDHVARFDARLASLVEQGDRDGVQLAAKLSAEGCRNVLWEAEADEYVPFAAMAAETVLKMHACASNDEKEATGKALNAHYSPPASSSCAHGQLGANERVIQDAESRLLRILWFVALLRPDVLCVQELDNFAYVSKQLEALGYDCGAKDATYQMLRDRSEAPYEARLRASRLAFAPKTDLKKGASMARRLLEKKGKPDIDGEAYAIDDEGCAIFWHRERLTLLEGPDFRALPGQKDVDDYIGGASESLERAQGDAGAVRVRLGFAKAGWRGPVVSGPGHCVVVTCTHLSSGRNKEVRRIQELRSLWPPSGYPEIWCLDANTELDFADPLAADGNPCGVPQHANALNTFLRDRPRLSSVWAPHYGEARAVPPPVTVWKMRGPATAQHKKMGEDAYELIDHVFYDGRQLFGTGQQALRIRQRKPKQIKVAEHSDVEDGAPEVDRRDWLALLPNEIIPSDHLPVVWDFELSEAPRLGPTALADAAVAAIAARPGATGADECRTWAAGIAAGAALPELEREARRVLDAEEPSSPPRPVAAARACLFLAAATAGRRTLGPEVIEALAAASLACAFRAAADAGGEDESGSAYEAWLLGLAGHATEVITGRDAAAALAYTVLRGREFADARVLTSEAKAQLDTAEQPLELALLYALSVFKWEDESRDPGGSYACVVTGLVAALVDRRPAACRRGTPTEAAAMRCLKAVARSPNIDAGGGLDVLLTTLREHTLAIKKNESQKSELRARALGRPPPETTLAFVRAAAAVLCGKLPPERLLVKTAQLRRGAAGTERDAFGGSALDHLAASLAHVDDGNFAPEAQTVGYVLKILAEAGRASPAGRRALLALFLARDGLHLVAAIVEASATLDASTRERWRTHLRAVQLVALLCEKVGDDRLADAFQQRFVKALRADRLLDVLRAYQLPDDDLGAKCASVTADVLAVVEAAPDSPSNGRRPLARVFY